MGLGPALRSAATDSTSAALARNEGTPQRAQMTARSTGNWANVYRGGLHEAGNRFAVAGVCAGVCCADEIRDSCEEGAAVVYRRGADDHCRQRLADAAVRRRKLSRHRRVMPEDKYGYIPTSGKFDDARSFGEQVKHVACAQFAFFKE